MKPLLIIVVVFLLVTQKALSNPSSSPNLHWLKELSLKDVNGGTGCAACAILAGLTSQLAEIHNTSVTNALDKLCNFLPSQYQFLCTEAFKILTPSVIKLLEAKETPDIVCHAVGLCKNETGQFCHIFPLPKQVSDQDVAIRVKSARKIILQASPYLKRVGIKFCDIFKPLCDALNDHLPLVDSDKDYFSTEGTIRGYYWRGKDCNDKDNNIYPGRHTVDDSEVDTNCNGIFGVDPTTGRTYESLWCEGSQQMGTVVLGDSASAHFHIPPDWFNTTAMNSSTFQDFELVLENEFDWPMLSSVTGFTNTSSWPSSITGKVDSYYLRLLEMNRCNHRDYQNIAVNGARASAMAEQIVKSFARRGTRDNPVFLTLALIGNDVCNGHPNMDHMTKPKDFYDHMTETLQYLDKNIANGSVVIVSGLVDGRVLYDILHDLVHPLGSLHNDVTYSSIYDYLNCLEISPCFGWLNSNETWRNRTTERAMELNNALKDAIANFSATNFKVYYIDSPLPNAIKTYAKEGRNPANLIEPVDGFHPSQDGQALTTELMFQILQKMDGVLPKANPFNDEIKNQFGDQGGYAN